MDTKNSLDWYRPNWKCLTVVDGTPFVRFTIARRLVVVIQAARSSPFLNPEAHTMKRHLVVAPLLICLLALDSFGSMTDAQRSAKRAHASTPTPPGITGAPSLGVNSDGEGSPAAIETFVSTNFQVQFEATEFSTAELTSVRPLAQSMPQLCENDSVVMGRWFGLTVSDVFGSAHRVIVTLTKGVRGASNTGFSNGNSRMNVNPLGRTQDGVLSLFANEMIEILMRFKGDWDPGDSGGEGLSRVAGDLLHPTSAGNNVNAWIASDPTTDATAAKDDSEFRKDWVSKNFKGGDLKAGGHVNGDDDSYSIGCAMLFIFFLKDQLGFTMAQIVQSGKSTLGDTYTALTGDKSGGFARFKRLVDSNFPAPTKGSAGDNPFPLFLLHAPTPLALADTGNGDSLIAPKGNDPIADVYFVKRRNTASGTIEMHGLSGKSDYKQFRVQTGTALLQSDDANGDFLLADGDHDGVPDLYFIKRRNTGSGRIELHALSGKSNYRNFILHTPTPLQMTEDANGNFALADFDGDGIPDLVFIKRRKTANNKIEVHVLGSKSNYQAFVRQTETTLAQAEDGNGDFFVADFDSDHLPDLFFIKRRNTGTGAVEVHVLTAVSNFQQFAIHTPTLILSSDEANGTFGLGDYDSDDRQELYFIKNKNAQSNNIEIHVAPIPRATATN